MPARSSKADKKTEEVKNDKTKLKLQQSSDYPRKDDENLCPVEASVVRDWLKSLDGGLRERVVCKTDVGLAKLIRDMAQHPGATQDKGYFHEVTSSGARKSGKIQQSLMGSEAVGWVGFEGSSDVYDHLPSELWGQVGIQSEVFRAGCAKLLEVVRICDGVDEYDTLTLCPAVARDSSALFALMKPVTFGAFMEVPAQLKWCAKRRRWRCLPLPAFSCLPLFNLSMFVAHELEKAIWECYSLYSSKTALIPELLSREMELFWSGLNKYQRQEYLASIRPLITSASPSSASLEARLCIWTSTVDGEVSPRDESDFSSLSTTSASSGTSVLSTITCLSSDTSTTNIASAATAAPSIAPSSPQVTSSQITPTMTISNSTVTATTASVITSSSSTDTQQVSINVPEYLFYVPLDRFSLPEQAIIAHMKIALRCVRAASIEETLVSSDIETVSTSKRGKKKKQHKQSLKLDEEVQPVADESDPQPLQELAVSDDELLSLEEVDLLAISKPRRVPDRPFLPSRTSHSSSSGSGASSTCSSVSSTGGSGSNSSSYNNTYHSSSSETHRRFSSSLERRIAAENRRGEGVKILGDSRRSGIHFAACPPSSSWNRSSSAEAGGIVRRNVGILPGGKIGFGGGGGSSSIYSSFGRSSLPSVLPNVTIRTHASPPSKVSILASTAPSTSAGTSVTSVKSTALSTAGATQKTSASPNLTHSIPQPNSDAVSEASQATASQLTTTYSSVTSSMSTKPAPTGAISAEPKRPIASDASEQSSSATSSPGSNINIPASTNSNSGNTGPISSMSTSTTNVSGSPTKPVLSRVLSARSRKNADGWYTDWFCSPQVAPTPTPTKSPPVYPSPTSTTSPLPNSSLPVLWLDWDMGFNDLLGANGQNSQTQSWSGLPDSTSSLSDWQTSSQVWDRPSSAVSPDTGWKNSHLDRNSPPAMESQNAPVTEQFTLFPSRFQAERSGIPTIQRASPGSMHSNQMRPGEAVIHMNPRGLLRGPPPGFAPAYGDWEKLNEEVLSLSKQLKQALAAKADEENMHRMRLQVERSQYADQLLLYRDIHQGCLDQIEALRRERDFFQTAHQQALTELREAQQALEGRSELQPPPDTPGPELDTLVSTQALPDPLIISEEAPDIMISDDEEVGEIDEETQPNEVKTEVPVNPRHPSYRRSLNELSVNTDVRPQRTSQSTPPEPRSRVSLPRSHTDEWVEDDKDRRRRTLPLARRDFMSSAAGGGGSGDGGGGGGGKGMYGASDSCPNFALMDRPPVIDEPVTSQESSEQSPSVEETTPVEETTQYATPSSPSFILCAERSASLPQSPHIKAISKRVRSLSPPLVRSALSALTVYKDNGKELAPMRKLSWPRAAHNQRVHIANRRVETAEEATRWKAEFLSQEWPPLSVNKSPPTPPSDCPSPSNLLNRTMRGSPPAEDSEMRDYSRRQRATSNPEVMVQDWPPMHRASTGGSSRSEDASQGKASTGRARSARRVKGVTLTSGVSLPSRPRGRLVGVSAPSHFTRSRMGLVTFDDPLDLVQDMSSAERKAHDRVYRAQEAPYILQSVGQAVRPQPHPPWADHPSATHDSQSTQEGMKPVANSQLHAEIKKFDRYVTRICAAAEVFVQHVIDKIKRIVASLWENVEIKKYGSFATGLWLPCSDVDLVIVGGNPGNNEGSVLMSGIRSALHSLACELGRRKWVESVRVINNTAVPVIKMIGSRHDTKVMVDITYCPFESSSPHTGLQSNHLIRHYISALPELRPLTLVLKQFLFEKGLSQTYTGGLSSYCLVLMLVSFLQSQILLDRQEPESKGPLPSLPPEMARQRSHDSPDVIGRKVANNAREVDSRRHSFDERDSFPAPLKPRRRHSFTMNDQSPLAHNNNKVNPLSSSSTSSSATSSSSASSSSSSLASSFSCSSSSLSSISSSSSSSSSSSAPRRRDLGKLLLGFLELYGRRFDYRHVGIAPQLHTGAGRGCYYTLGNATTTLVINDPLDPQGSLDPTKANNIGKGVFAMYRVKAAFDYAFSILSVPSASSRLRRIIDGPPLPCIPMPLRTAASIAQQSNADSTPSTTSYVSPPIASPSNASSISVGSPSAPSFSRPASCPSGSSPSFFTFSSHPTTTTSTPSTPTVTSTATPISASLPATPTIISKSPPLPYPSVLSPLANSALSFPTSLTMSATSMNSDSSLHSDSLSSEGEVESCAESRREDDTS